MTQALDEAQPEPTERRTELVDPSEFDAFYTASARRLVGQLTAMTGDPGEAQEVVQEAFARAWDKRVQFARADNPEAWVRRVAWNLAVSRWRKARNMALAWQRQGAPRAADAPDHLRPLLVAALRMLPDEQRRAIVLFHLCDLTVGQVAIETGVAVGTVKARLSRGRAALRERLAELDPGHSAPDTHGGES